MNQQAIVYRSSLLGAGLFVFVLSARHMGFALIFMAIVWLFWLPYSVYVILRKPAHRLSQLIRVLIWMIAAGLVTGVHIIRHYTIRQRADVIVTKISDYSHQHGNYPATLSEIGMTSDMLKEELGPAFYYPRDTQPPNFFYGVTFEPFAVYSYDFERQIWEYIPD